MPTDFSILNQARDLLPGALSPEARQYLNQRDARLNQAMLKTEQRPPPGFPDPSQPAPVPLRDTIQAAMPGEPQSAPWQAPTQQPGQPRVAPWETPPQQQQEPVGAMPSATPGVPGQLPQQASLTQPKQQYQYQPEQTQTVLDTLRQGAQIQ